MFKGEKKKIIYFHFYLMFPNIKKVKILTPIISNETMQSNSKRIQQSPAPSVLLLYTTVESTPKNSMTRVWLENFMFTKNKQTPTTCRTAAIWCLQVNLQTCFT